MEKNHVTAEKLIIIGGSAGSLEVILSILPGIPPGLQAAIIIVLHRKADSDFNSLTDILQRKTTLKVQEAEEKESIQPGSIYIAPADYHLLIEADKSFSLDYSEKIHFSRPSIDVSFEAAADIFKENLTGILLSGANSDGAFGLTYIRSQKGISIVQDPASADVDFMPKYALTLQEPDYIFDPEGIKNYISEWGISIH